MGKETKRMGSWYEQDSTASVFQDDVTLNARHTNLHGGGGESPEKRLLLAVLTDAIACVRQPRWSRSSESALEWILESREDGICSFDNVCELLELEPTSVRRRVLEDLAATTSLRIPVTVKRRARRIPVVVAA